MSKTVSLSSTDLNFNHTAVGTQTAAQTVTIRNSGTELVIISSSDTTTNFEFRETGTPPYVSSMGEKKLGRVFLPGVLYYTDLNGNLTTDNTITGNIIGMGNADETLLVLTSSYILDHTGAPILDHLGTPILDHNN